MVHHNFEMWSLRQVTFSGLQMNTYTPECINECKPKNSDIETLVCKYITVFGAAKSVGIN